MHKCGVYTAFHLSEQGVYTLLNSLCMNAHLLNGHRVHLRRSWHLLPILYTYSDIYLPFREFRMDPRTFLAPVQCGLCSLLLYTLSDVSRHCSYHENVDFICHHCLTQFDSKSAIGAHMNQKGAHLRPPFDPSTYLSAMPSPAPSTLAVRPLSLPAPSPTPTLSGSSPTTPVVISDSTTLDQLLRDIVDTSTTGTDAAASSIKDISPPFQPQAASTQQHSFSSPDVSPTVGTRPTTSVSYPPGEYRKLRQQNTEYKFLLWWCLHHLKSLPAPPPVSLISLYAVCDRAAPVWRELITKFHDMHVQTVTKFP